MNKLSQCVCKGCFGIARWTPYILVRIPENDNSFQIDLNMPLCDKHQGEFKFDDVLPETSIKAIQKLFTKKFIHPPKKENMVLQWKATTVKLVDSFGRLLREAEVKHGAIVE